MKREEEIDMGRGSRRGEIVEMFLNNKFSDKGFRVKVGPAN